MKGILYKLGLLLIVSSAISAIWIPLIARAQDMGPSKNYYKKVIEQLPKQLNGTIEGFQYDVPQIVEFTEGDNIYYGILVVIHTWKNQWDWHEGALLLCDGKSLWSNAYLPKHRKILDTYGGLSDTTSIEACWSQYMTSEEDDYLPGSLLFTADKYGDQKLLCAYHGKWKVLLEGGSAGLRTILPGPTDTSAPPNAIVTLGKLYEWGELSDYEEQGNPLTLWMDANKIGYPPDATGWKLAKDSMLYLQYYPAFGVLYAYKMNSAGVMYGEEHAPDVVDFSRRL